MLNVVNQTLQTGLCARSVGGREAPQCTALRDFCASHRCCIAAHQHRPSLLCVVVDLYLFRMLTSCLRNRGLREGAVCCEMTDRVCALCLRKRMLARFLCRASCARRLPPWPALSQCALAGSLVVVVVLPDRHVAFAQVKRCFWVWCAVCDVCCGDVLHSCRFRCIEMSGRSRIVMSAQRGNVAAIEKLQKKKKRGCSYIYTSVWLTWTQSLCLAHSWRDVHELVTKWDDGNPPLDRSFPELRAGEVAVLVPLANKSHFFSARMGKAARLFDASCPPARGMSGLLRTCGNAACVCKIMFSTSWVWCQQAGLCTLESLVTCLSEIEQRQLSSAALRL